MGQPGFAIIRGKEGYSYVPHSAGDDGLVPQKLADGTPVWKWSSKEGSAKRLVESMQEVWEAKHPKEGGQTPLQESPRKGGKK